MQKHYFVYYKKVNESNVTISVQYINEMDVVFKNDHTITPSLNSIYI